ncbi:hypothetical protein GQ54DRAFT_179735 [Martensiomyces pterosporus]|nr:hypothetical protein GQ54DRAFT_179735 [Martensiomyces pterosporus]
MHLYLQLDIDWQSPFLRTQRSLDRRHPTRPGGRRVYWEAGAIKLQSPEWRFLRRAVWVLRQETANVEAFNGENRCTKAGLAEQLNSGGGCVPVLVCGAPACLQAANAKPVPVGRMALVKNSTLSACPLSDNPLADSGHRFASPSRKAHQ